MSGSSLIFYITFVLIISFALVTIFARNIFYSLLSAMAVFFLAGEIYYILGSSYNAVIQIAIYGVAVPVILGLAIMFTNTRKPVDSQTGLNLKYLMLFICGLFVLGIIYLTLTALVISPDTFALAEIRPANPVEVISAFGDGIFGRYVWAFEVVSVILTIIIAGLTIFKYRRKS